MWVGTVRDGLLSIYCEKCDIIALLFGETLSCFFFPSILKLFKFVLFKIPGLQIESRPLILGFFFFLLNTETQTCKIHSHVFKIAFWLRIYTEIYTDILTPQLVDFKSLIRGGERHNMTNSMEWNYSAFLSLWNFCHFSFCNIVHVHWQTANTEYFIEE